MSIKTSCGSSSAGHWRTGGGELTFITPARLSNNPALWRDMWSHNVWPMQIIRKQRKLVTVRRAARLRSAKLIIARLGRGHHGCAGAVFWAGQPRSCYATQDSPQPAQPSPAQPRPHFPNFPRQECGLAGGGSWAACTGHHHHTSHCLTQAHTVSSQGDGTCSHPPQRIKQFSFVRRFLGPVDMLIITLDTNFSLGWIQCSALPLLWIENVSKYQHCTLLFHFETVPLRSSACGNYHELQLYYLYPSLLQCQIRRKKEYTHLYFRHFWYLLRTPGSHDLLGSL